MSIATFVVIAIVAVFMFLFCIVDLVNSDAFQRWRNEQQRKSEERKRRQIAARQEQIEARQREERMREALKKEREATLLRKRLSELETQLETKPLAQTTDEPGLHRVRSENAIQTA